MKKIVAGKFKAQCLKVMEQVRTTRELVLVTKRLEGVVTLVGDVESPIVPLQDGEALR
jgi:PHD/YefM family antitoxin component YafN of YafNO toxin-antitoxin module